MPYGKPLMGSSLIKVVTMCHCPIGDAIHKVVFHMTLHDWFDFVRVRSATCDEGLTSTKDGGTCLRRLNMFRKEVH